MGMLGAGSRRNKLSIRAELGVRSATSKEFGSLGGAAFWEKF